MPIKMQDILSENMPDKMQGRMPKYKCQRGCQRSCKDLCQKESTSVFTIQIKSLGLCNKPTWSLDQLGPCTSVNQEEESRKSRKELVLKVNQCWPPWFPKKNLGPTIQQPSTSLDPEASCPSPSPSAITIHPWWSPVTLSYLPSRTTCFAETMRFNRPPRHLVYLPTNAGQCIQIGTMGI